MLTDSVSDCFKGIDEVWHLAANPDVRVALENTKFDLEQNILVTFRVLEAVREEEVKRILFTSTSTVYGEADQIPTPESYGPPTPISFYGATELACEALISAYCHTFGARAKIKSLGWTPRYDSKKSVETAIQNLSHAESDRWQPRD